MAITRYEAASPVLGSLVSVFLTGTQVFATIYADALLTPLGNPFTSDALTGVYVFYADDAVAYDITLGTTGVPTPPPPATSEVAFAQMAVVGGAAIVATVPADAMGFVAGANVTLTADPATKRIQIDAAGGGGGSGITQLTGDVTAGPGTGSQAATLVATAVTPGAYGDATHVARVVVDQKGRLTSVTEVPISGGGGGSGTVINDLALSVGSLLIGAGGVHTTILGTFGTANQVLHGNVSGAPSWGAVANADLATMPANTLKANLTGGAATPTDATLTEVATALDLLSVPSAVDTVVPFGKTIFEGIAVSTPAAPSASTGRLYFDISGGKVRLMVLFPSGAAQVVKAEL